jgi:DNA invertase Pin-like site-specific DNA recombinase
VVYLRSSEDTWPLALQENTIKDLLQVKGIEADKIEVDETPMGALLDERTDFKSFIHALRPGDTIYIYDLAVLSPKVGELVQFFNCLFEHDLRLVIAKYDLTIDKESRAEDVIRILNTLRQENKAKKMGRPKGSISRSKYDKYREKIVEMIKEGRSVSEMAKVLGVSRTSLRDYIVSRNLKEVALGERVAQELPKTECKIDMKG